MEFDEGFKHILAMKSLEGEVVPLSNAVTITDEVEAWKLFVFSDVFISIVVLHLTIMIVYVCIFVRYG